MRPRTLYEKIFDEHVVADLEDGTFTVYIDRHLVEDHASSKAFAPLRASGTTVRAAERTLAVVDHNTPLRDWTDRESRAQIAALLGNAQAFGLDCYGIGDARQGITHVVGAEQGFILPGCTVACGDSHTATNGALGALAFGVGTSDVEHILRTQTLVTPKLKTLRITVTGTLARGVEAKDLILALVGQLGAAGAAGHAIEFDGPGTEALSVEARMTSAIWPWKSARSLG